jgi:hypothetical protein
MYNYIYNYIYIYRERERERCICIQIFNLIIKADLEVIQKSLGDKHAADAADSTSVRPINVRVCV